jgi:hypothetical protein
MEIGPVESKFSDADIQTKATVAFHSFANEPKKYTCSPVHGKFE